MPNFGQCHYYPTILRWICSMFSEEVETQYMCQACIEANKAYCWDYIDVTRINDDHFLTFLHGFGVRGASADSKIAALQRLRQWQIGQIEFEEFQQISNYEAYCDGEY